MSPFEEAPDCVPTSSGSPDRGTTREGILGGILCAGADDFGIGFRAVVASCVLALGSGPHSQAV